MCTSQRPELRTKGSFHCKSKHEGACYSFLGTGLCEDRLRSRALRIGCGALGLPCDHCGSLQNNMVTTWGPAPLNPTAREFPHGASSAGSFVCELFQRILLVASDARHESQLAALLDERSIQDCTRAFELLYLGLRHTDGVLLLFDIVHCIQAGMFWAVSPTPHVATWSRPRHSNSPGQLPLRSCSEQLGVSRINPAAQAKVLASHRERDMVAWRTSPAVRFSSGWFHVVVPRESGWPHT